MELNIFCRFSFGASNMSQDTTQEIIPEDTDTVPLTIPSTPALSGKFDSKTPKSVRRRSVSMSCFTPIVETINQPPTNQACSSFLQKEYNFHDLSSDEEGGDGGAGCSKDEDKIIEDNLNLRALLSPEKKKRKEKVIFVRN